MRSAWILIVVAFGCGKSRDEQPSRSGESQERIAKLAVEKYAYEAYPTWAASNPSKACPDKLADLDEYMTSKGGRDPWGTPYRMRCGRALPPDVKGGIAVDSAGIDMKLDTEDDVRSW